MKAIILTKGRIATVDDEDFDRTNQFKWHAVRKKNHYYAKRWNGEKGEYLHTFLLGGVLGIDHENGDGLDNRKENLRKASKAQNGRSFQTKPPGSTSQYRGVCWLKNRWAAQIVVNRKVIYLGRFEVEEEAARAYDEAAQLHFGDFATLNFPR